MGPSGVSRELDLGEARREAARIAARAEIGDVRLFSSRLELVEFPQGGDLRYSVSVTPKSDFETSADTFVVRSTYVVTIDNASDDAVGDASGEVATVEFELGGLFQLQL